VSADVLSQLRDYGSLLEDAQDPLTVSDAISRAQHIQTLPDDQPGIGAGQTKRRARVFVFVAGLVVLVVVSILLASLQTEVPPAGTSIPGPDLPTTLSGPSDPAEIGRSYFRTLDDADESGWWALFADDAEVVYLLDGGERRGSIALDSQDGATEARRANQAIYDFLTAIRATYTDVTCSADGSGDGGSGRAIVNCTYTYESLITKVMDLILPGRAQFAVQDGRIITVNYDIVDFAPVQDVPNSYLQERQPDTFSGLCEEVPGRGAACARLYLRNLEGIAQAWEER